MGRPKKQQTETLKPNVQDALDIDEVFTGTVIDNEPQIIIDNEPIKEDSINGVFRKGGIGSVDLHRVIFNGADRWWTENQIKIALQTQHDHLKFPEGSLYNQDTKNIPCKTCGK